MAGASLTASNIGGNVQFLGPILATGAPGGDVSISAASGSNGSIVVHNIDVSSTNSGVGGSITLQPDDLISIDPSLGTVPAGTILFIGSSIQSLSNGGAGGTILLASAGRSSTPTVATMFSSYSLTNGVNFAADSLTMGINEMMTIYGDSNINMGSIANVGNIVSLGTLTLTAPTINAIQASPSISYQLLAFDGSFYESSAVHFCSYLTPVITGAVNPSSTREETASSFIPSQSEFKLSLMYGPPTGTPLSFDQGSPIPPPPPPPSPTANVSEIEKIVYEFNVANSQLSYLLPLIESCDKWPFFKICNVYKEGCFTGAVYRKKLKNRQPKF